MIEDDPLFGTPPRTKWFLSLAVFPPAPNVTGQG
jgi:hypothetical protein